MPATQAKTTDRPEYTLLPFTSAEAPSKASPANTTEPSDQKWISTNDALSAQLWRTVMAVQWPLENQDGDLISTFNIAIDGRQRTDPKVYPHTMGCFLEYVAIKALVRKMLEHLNIADLAGFFRKAIHKADKRSMDDVATLIKKTEDVDRLLPTAFLDVPSFNCVQTSLLRFELYGIDWGSLLGQNIDAMRVPHVGTINGLQVVLPVLPSGGTEVMVGVEKSLLERLLNDHPLFTKNGAAR
ncbi:uncharacterized protein N7477_003472 [Penicillium maclennaniae]|uniref:uncharacterized protein n=1 Tax=Penicillium maclennaniae TaxID=1343394 RepID=UPI0025417558|nr:uncharacterized protein N7477_003472 [Penicillium maclennaniae]KAJ5677839.1 hypothetical protein N7477_003472 [Penicillium maclennaniae]